MEAALVLPLFIFAMCLIAYMGLLMTYESRVTWAMTRAAREASAAYGAKESKVFESLVYYQGLVTAYTSGTPVLVSLLSSDIMEENEEIDLVGDYGVKLPFRVIKTPLLTFRVRVHTRAFVGVDSREKSKEDGQEIVYVTEHGRVYHRDLDCTYLTLSLSQVVYGDLEALRNAGGGIYKECERCCKNRSFSPETKVWITNYGDRFHTSNACKSLKRSIRKIHLREVGSRVACSKCGGKK